MTEILDRPHPTRIEVLGFRSLRAISQPLMPFQVLVGPNASGKSTFLDVIAFLRDLVRAGVLAAIEGDLRLGIAQRAPEPQGLRPRNATKPADPRKAVQFLLRRAEEPCSSSTDRELAREAITRPLVEPGKPDPWGPDIKASDEFLDPLFRSFFAKLALPNLMAKTDYHTLAPFVPAGQIDPEVREKLDRIVEVGRQARPARRLDG
jgi:hypothetical protein